MIVTGYDFGAGEDDVPIGVGAVTDEERAELLLAARADKYTVKAGQLGRLEKPWHGHPAGAAALRRRRASGGSHVLIAGERK